MKCLSFKKWIESQVLGGGLEPPKQSPVDPSPAPGQSRGAFPTYNAEENPPTKKNKFRMKKKMKKI